MSSRDDAVGGPLAAADLRRMVDAVAPDWQVVDATPSGSGTDAVYYLTVAADGARRDVVLKARLSGDPAAFRPEPYLLDAISRETSVPVPAVYGVVDDHDDLPAPFFLMERRRGENLAATGAELTETALQRVARDAGRYLGELHGLGSFARFGDLRLRRDVATDEGGGITGPGYEITVADDAVDGWREWFTRLTDDLLANLDERFRDLEGPVRAHVEREVDLLDGQFEPVPGHTDYRYWNLLLDPETGETRAVLDFGNEFTVHSEYNLAQVEHHLSGWAPLEAERRELVRQHLLEGYTETNALQRDGNLWPQYDLYLLATWLRGLVWFSTWHAEGGGERRDARAETLRDVVEALLD